MLLRQDPRPLELLQRSLYTAAPAAKTTHDNRPTLLVSWWCTGFALAIILVRIVGRYIRTERLFMEDRIMALSIIPLLARMAFVHVILRYGTNNAIIPDDLNADGLMQREIGSKLVLASRIMYAAFLWIAKLTISEFLKRLTSRFWRRTYEAGLQTIRYFLLVTFIAVLIATLSECQPFNHYWQVVPDPGPRCRQGVAQLMTMGVCDIMTDFLLICFPIPIVLRSRMPLKRKISLVALFALSLILVAITLYRIIEVIDHKYDQQFRSLLASLEILAAAAVSNALVLGSFVRDKGTKKQRFRHHAGSASAPSTIEQESRARRLTQQTWGSDADLAGDLGISCTHEMDEKETATSRPAPMALPLGKDARNLTPMPRHQHEYNETPQTMVRDDDGLSGSHPRPNGMPNTPTRATFFDYGGLLNDDDRTLGPSHQSISHPPVRNLSRPTSPLSRNPQLRKGSDAFLEDVGGLMAAQGPASENRPPADQRGLSLVDVLRETEPNAEPQRHRTNKRGRGMTPEIQDAGGLLR